MVTLRPDQRIAVEALYAHLRAGVRRVLVQAPTGWGKGTVAAELLRRCEAQGRKALFVSHLADINRDIAARAKAYGCQRVGVMMGSAPEGDADPAVVVATVQTLFARRVERPAADLVLWDECHRAAASSYADVRAAYPGAVHVGFSATPERADGATLGDAFDVLVPGPSPLELVALGCLAPVRVLAPTETTQALAREPWEAWPGGSPGVLFAHSLAHSRECAEQLLTLRGIRAAHVDADTKDREALIRAFNDGALDVLCCYRLFVEGVDVPRAEVVMLATLFGHAGGYLQAVGRGRRVAAGKVGCTVVDLRGNVHRHGLPDEARTYHLDGEAIRRAEKLPSIVQCRKCHAWGPGGQTCSACGAQLPPPPPPKVLARDLVEVRTKADSTDDRFARLVRFVRDAMARGSNPWSAAHRYRGTYGEAPARADMVAAIRAAS